MSDDYPTDEWLKTLFCGYFDPCPLNPTVDGLIIDWGYYNFVNPPYSKPLPWVRKAIIEYKKNKTIVLLLKMDTSTVWFKELQEAGAHFLWINGRLKYGTGTSANFPSMLAVLNGGKNEEGNQTE